MIESFEHQEITNQSGLGKSESQETMSEVRQRRAKDLYDQNKSKFEAWIKQRNESSSTPTLDIPEEVRSVLIPTRIYELAHNIDNVEVVVSSYKSDDEMESLKIIVVEKDYPFPLTDPQEWAQWKEKKRKLAASNEPVKLYPKPSNAVNRFHAEYETLIDQGLFDLQDRVLFEVTLRLDKKTLASLYVAHFNAEIGKGVATDFYTDSLPFFAKAIGCRFITGRNDSVNVGFFVEKFKRKTLEQIKPDKIPLLFPKKVEDRKWLSTVQFLYREDESEFLLET